MAKTYRVVTKGESFTVKETIEANSEVEARLRSQYADAGFQQGVSLLTHRASSVKKKLELCSPS